MCGRYSLAADLEDIQRRFELFDSELTYSPRYNIAPTQPVLAVTNDEGGQPAYLRWGLIPSWAKSASVGNRLINARAETVAERPSFRTALSSRRCLVIADGFYEWQTGRKCQKAHAGCDEVGRGLRLCRSVGLVAGSSPAILSGPAPSSPPSPNELLRPIHNRMPVILPKELESLWLDDEVQDPFALADILSPYPAQAMQAYEVSPAWSIALPMKALKWLSPVSKKALHPGLTKPSWRCSSMGTMRPSLNTSSILSN